MIYRKFLALLTIFIIFLFSSNNIFGSKQDNRLSEAIRLFDEGQFENAEPILKKLLDEKPDHLMVNYYYGACRTENGHYGTNEIIYLLNGSVGEAPLKTDYYIAVQYHAENRWDEALKYYTLFKNKTDNGTQAEVELTKKMQMCSDHINPFVAADDDNTTAETQNSDILPTPIPREAETEPFEPIIDETTTTTETADSAGFVPVTDSVDSDSSATISKDENPVFEKEPERILNDPINFVVTPEITYPDTSFFKTPMGLKYYDEGKSKQNELEQTINETDKLRKQYASTNSYSERQSLGEVILTKESSIFELREISEELLLKAQQEEAGYWQNASFNEKEELKKEVQDYLDAVSAMSAPEKPDTIILVTPSVAPVQRTISHESEETEDELIYKIQIGAYSRGLPAYVKRLFDKLSYIRKIENYTDEKGIVVYTTGNLTNFEDALRMQEQVRREGIEDAYVVPYFNGKRITLSEAKEIENDK
ncbi:SPOR domain-containing protein [uncultured Draconibacterium sp.]|uniref:SPOR domain-containing protein n=1 Tax=uncultured Draconibacterium sp. TaxID=1573823 RepID=UPI002AA6FADB|nr:SPOR domain-containing protein [uncultured Draconibacterium sp.]